MHIRYIAYTLFLFIAAIGFALEIPYPEVSFAPSMGIVYGNSKEFVYADNSKISELVWPLTPVYLLDLETQVMWNEKLAILVDDSIGVPRASGTLTDTDFLNVAVNGNTEKTDYSEHDAQLNQMLLVTLNASWAYHLQVRGIASTTAITVTPSIGFRYFSIKWTGYDGYGQYTYGHSAWSETIPKTIFKGRIIEYSQRYLAPQAGLKVTIPIGNHFAVTSGFIGSPSVWCDGIDNHETTKTDYFDSLSRGIFLEPNVRIHWYSGQTLSVFADCEWTHIFNLRGRTEKNDRITHATTLYEEENGGGAEYTAWTMKVGIKKTFSPGNANSASEKANNYSLKN